MPVCDGHIPEGALPTSLGGRVVTPPGIAARAIGDAGRRRGEQRAAARRREQPRVLPESAQRTASA
jgi:hypothetical protein